MNWNYSNIEKKYWELPALRFMVMTKITLDIWMLGPFHNKSDSLQVYKMCGRTTICKYTEFCNKATYFCFKTKLYRKGNVRNFWLHSLFFFRKFHLYNTDFRSLFLQISRIWELFFLLLLLINWKLLFCVNFYACNRKPLFCLVETSFFWKNWLLRNTWKQQNFE